MELAALSRGGDNMGAGEFRLQLCFSFFEIFKNHKLVSLVAAIAGA